MVKKIFLIIFLFNVSIYAEQVIYIPSTSLKSIDAESLLERTQILSSDEFEGRGVGTRGEVLATNYIADIFKTLGLIACGENGTYFQKVPLIGITPDPETITLEFSNFNEPLNYRDDYVVWTNQEKRLIDLASKDVIFVGYGVTAPEYGWDDFKDVDVKDKILIALINDPQIPDPKKPEVLDERP